MDTKKWSTSILKFVLAIMVEIVDLSLRAIIDSFEIYTVNSLIKKKIRE